MSIKAINWAWGLRLPPTSKLILMAIADSASDMGECWMSNSLTAEKCSVSTRTVQRMISKFASMGLLSIQPRYTPSGRQTSNIYKLNLDSNVNPDNLSPSLEAEVNRDDKLSGSGVTSSVTPGDDSTVSPPEPPNDPSEEPQQQRGQRRSRGSGLHFHASLTDNEHAAIIELADGLPLSDVQLLLDELTDALESKTIRTDALRWFAGVVRRQRKGTFVPLGAVRIAERRRAETRRRSNLEIQPQTQTDKELGKQQLANIKGLLRTDAVRDDPSRVKGSTGGRSGAQSGTGEHRTGDDAAKRTLDAAR